MSRFISAPIIVLYSGSAGKISYTNGNIQAKAISFLIFLNIPAALLPNPRPVFFVLVDEDDKIIEIPVNADPRSWYPYTPGDKNRKSLIHRISVHIVLPKGQWRVGLWLPDASESIRLRPDYAVRVANRDVPSWTDSRNQYGINILGAITVK